MHMAAICRHFYSTAEANRDLNSTASILMPSALISNVTHVVPKQPYTLALLPGISRGISPNHTGITTNQHTTDKHTHMQCEHAHLHTPHSIYRITERAHFQLSKCESNSVLMIKCYYPRWNCQKNKKCTVPTPPRVKFSHVAYKSLACACCENDTGKKPFKSINGS